jgi:hypothetical protein
MSDIENRLHQLKKDIETKGVATLYLQRDGRGQVCAFTVLDSETVKEIPPAEAPNSDQHPGYMHHVAGSIPPTRLSNDEILIIDARQKDEAKTDTPDPKAKKKAAA